MLAWLGHTLRRDLAGSSTVLEGVEAPPVDVAQLPEVQLRNLTGWTLLHAHSPGVATAPVTTLDEPAQRGVGHPAAPLGQQLLDAGHPADGPP